jgi:hypothetical protein
MHHGGTMLRSFDHGPFGIGCPPVPSVLYAGCCTAIVQALPERQISRDGHHTARSCSVTRAVQARIKDDH